MIKKEVLIKFVCGDIQGLESDYIVMLKENSMIESEKNNVKLSELINIDIKETNTINEVISNNLVALEYNKDRLKKDNKKELYNIIMYKLYDNLVDLKMKVLGIELINFELFDMTLNSFILYTFNFIYKMIVKNGTIEEIVLTCDDEYLYNEYLNTIKQINIM